MLKIIFELNFVMKNLKDSNKVLCKIFQLNIEKKMSLYQLNLQAKG
jgi:hypothetical protein